MQNEKGARFMSRTLSHTLSHIEEIFGSMVFNESVQRQRLPENIFAQLQSAMNEGKRLTPEAADVIAGAMKDWAIEKGATHFTHWFQPMTGITAEKHDSFISPVKRNNKATADTGAFKDSGAVACEGG